MKKIFLLLSIILLSSACSKSQETSFKTDALESEMYDVENTPIAFKDIIEKYKGKTVVVDIWASWCSDCIKGMPKLKALQNQYPNVVYLFISMDKNYAAWQRGIEKYDVKGEHYLTSDGMKGVFGKSVDVSWIPRYMIIDKTGKIALYNVIEADDDKLIETLNTLK
jgi:thiol-disulfide isomerase/thioredoxin